MTLYKKLILTFTLAAGLGALPNAFAAPVAKPKPTTQPAPKQNHVEDSAAVFVAFKNAGTKPGPAPKPNTTSTPRLYGEDKIDVLAAAAPPPAPGKQRTTTPAPSPTPNKAGAMNQDQDSIDVLAATATPKQVTPPGGVRSQTAAPGGPKHSEDNATVLAAFKPPVTTPGPGPKPNTTKTGGQNQEQDSTIV